MSAQPLKITELDRTLESDADGVAVKRYVEQLSEGRRLAVEALDKGVTSPEHARLTTLVSAYDRGLEALPKIWAIVNNNR